MLGQSPSRVVGVFNKGFVYRYFGTPDKEGYLGEMSSLQCARPWFPDFNRGFSL